MYGLCLYRVNLCLIIEVFCLWWSSTRSTGMVLFWIALWYNRVILWMWCEQRCGRLDDQIALLKHKLHLIHQGLAFNGRRTKTARSQGKKFQVSIEQEATRLLVRPYRYSLLPAIDESVAVHCLFSQSLMNHELIVFTTSMWILCFFFFLQGLRQILAVRLIILGIGIFLSDWRELCHAIWRSLC